MTVADYARLITQLAMNQLLNNLLHNIFQKESQLGHAHLWRIYHLMTVLSMICYRTALLMPTVEVPHAANLVPAAEDPA